MTRSNAKKGLLGLLILALCLCGGAVVYLRHGGGSLLQAEDRSDKSLYRQVDFRVEPPGAGAAEVIHCLSGKDHIHYVYLPSYAAMDRVRIKLHTRSPLTLNGVALKEDMACGDFPVGEVLELASDGREPSKVMFVASENTGALYVDTATGGMSAIHADKTYREKVSLALFDASGRLDYQSRNTDQIHGHGQTTWKLEKKSYNLKLDSAAGLLGMGKAAKWVLVANTIDESSLRNWIAYTLAGEVSPYPGFSPQCAFVDLYLNGRYNGLYLLCEEVEAHPSRLDISRDSCLFVVDFATRFSGLENAFDLGGGMGVKVKSPSPCSAEQLSALEQRLAEFQAALLSEDGVSPGSGRAWDDYIDLDSFARKYLIEEILQNYDAGSCSQYYFWNAPDDRLYAGPCWDYDCTLGIYLQKTPNCFLAQREWRTPGIYMPWFHALWQKEAFRQRVVELYRSEFQPAIRRIMEVGLPGKAREIRSASALNRLRWYSYYDNNKTMTGSLDALQTFLALHVDFLDSAWIEEVDYRTVCFKLDDKRQFQFYCLPAGSPCTELPTPQDYGMKRGYAWHLPDGTPFDPATILTEDLYLEARSGEGAKQ